MSDCDRDHGDPVDTIDHRDLFAAAALAGMIVRDHPETIEDRARMAYLYADAMLAERGR